MEESPIVHAQSTVQLSELDDVQFQRSMSLPRGFGGQKQQTGVHYGPVVPPPRSDSMHALKTMMARRHKIRVSPANNFCLKKHNSRSTLRLFRTAKPYFCTFIDIHIFLRILLIILFYLEHPDARLARPFLLIPSIPAFYNFFLTLHRSSKVTTAAPIALCHRTRIVLRPALTCR